MSKSQHRRSVVKAITWRITGTLDTFLIAWIITGSPTIGAAIGGIEAFTKTFLYYFHERIWEKSKFGLHDTDK